MTSSIVQTSGGEESLHAAGEEAARRAIMAAYGVPFSTAPSRISIKKDALGKPYGLYGENLSPVAISISHSFPFAFSVATTEKGVRLGTDIERIRHFPRSTSESFLTLEEKEIVAHAPARAETYLQTLCWSCKEAVLKALGIGLRCHPANIDVSRALFTKTSHVIIAICTVPFRARIQIRHIDSDFIAVTVAIPDVPGIMDLISYHGRT